MKPISMIIGGDLVPTPSNVKLFSQGDSKGLIGDELGGLLGEVDFRIFNLEVPLTESEQPIRKVGPNLIAPISSINGIKALNPTILGIANNHILDQGEQGLFSTMTLLESNNIRYVGAGTNINEAAMPVIVSKEGRKIGIYACAEHEFTIATNKKAGANPFDPLESLDHISKMYAECDFVIVLYHGGKEHYRYPSPYLQKVCRKMVEKGADLIICQHSHCIGAYEEYKGSPIVYGQGNFIFDASEEECWQTSLLVKVIFTDKMSVDYIPICKKANAIALADKQQKQEILEAFFHRSLMIKEPDFIENNFENFCATMGEHYLRSFAGYSDLMSRVDRRLQGMFIKRRYDAGQLAAMQNFIECEAHREMVLKYLSRG